MKYETFAFTAEEYGSSLTEQSHQTLYWLNRHGYLTNEVAEDLLSRMVVVPIRNHKNFGHRILEKFFGKKSTGDSYVFPITLLEDCEIIKDETHDKPTLTVVK